MGKYRPIIVTAECGTLTRAGKILGYTQPSLGYIISNLETELGVKIFHRDQRGVRLTEVGASIIDIMRQIEQMEDHLREVIHTSQESLLRVGIFPSVAAQWMPGIIAEFRKLYPNTAIKLQHQSWYLDGELGVLAGHETAAIALESGELRYTLNSATQIVAVGEGYSQVGPEGAVVLVSFAEDPTGLDEERVRRESEATKEQIRLKKSEQEYIRLRADLSRQMAELKVLKHRHGR